jgi:hypothetical protein
MKFLNVSVTPQRTTKLGNYPVYNEKDFSCASNIFNLPQDIEPSRSFEIATGGTNLILPPDEDQVDGYVCGIYERINNKTGLNWSQSTTYAAYSNPVYWSTQPSRNEWIRSDNVLLFNIYDNNNAIIRQEVLDAEFIFYRSGRFKPGCSNVSLVNVREAERIVEIKQPFTLPPNEYGDESNDMFVPAGTYDLNSAPGGECDNCPGTIILSYSKNGRWRYLLGGLNGFGCSPSTGYQPCLLYRQKRVFGDCGAGAWANTGSYATPPQNWNLCQFEGVGIPACAACG